MCSSDLPPTTATSAQTASVNAAPGSPDVPKPDTQSAPAPGNFTREWAERIALIENSRGTLTLAKAMALLLDISSEEELSRLLLHESEMSLLTWHAAYALGVGAGGKIVWGGGWRWKLPMHAAEAAHANCSQLDNATCEVVMMNGKFQADEFIKIGRAHV